MNQTYTIERLSQLTKNKYIDRSSCEILTWPGEYNADMGNATNCQAENAGSDDKRGRGTQVQLTYKVLFLLNSLFFIF